MASVHLHLNERFSARLQAHVLEHLPDEPIVLLGSKFSITVQNNSRLWPDVPKGDTYLHVVASDVRELFDQRRPPGIIPHAAVKDPTFDIYEPDTVMEFILNELKNYIPLEQEDIRADQVEIDHNLRYPIFVNDIGCWQYRPTTRSRIPNLFFAGAHCQQEIDVVTVETAVLSGLHAAEAVRVAAGMGAPVAIQYPVERPNYYYWPALVAGAPFAVLAKVWSELQAVADRSDGNEPDTHDDVETRKSRSVLGDLNNCGRLFLKMYADLACFPVEMAAELCRQVGGSARSPSRAPPAAPPERTSSAMHERRDGRRSAAIASLELCCAPYVVAARAWSDALERLFTR